MFQADLSSFKDKSILVTGGTGSFGRAFVKFMLDHSDVKRLVIFSRDELKQYEMQQDLAAHPKAAALRFFLGDVRDISRLKTAFRGIDYVVHAAALKQVVAAEYNPFEFIKTNVIGAENVVQVAIECGVRKVIALSTDKAANPVNLYGTSKLASDKIFVAGNHLSGGMDTRFAVVRYGNVVGSRGSVVPLFKRLLDQGVTELPITDERMTRFWITLPQGVQFVLSSFECMHGGEIFVPKIPSMKMTDLARAMAPQASYKIIGIRPGEKIHEVMVTEDDARNTLELSDRYVILPLVSNWDQGEKFNYKNFVGPVGDAFCYSSDKNDWRLNAEEIQSMIQESCAS